MTDQVSISEKIGDNRIKTAKRICVDERRTNDGIATFFRVKIEPIERRAFDLI